MDGPHQRGLQGTVDARGFVEVFAEGAFLIPFFFLAFLQNLQRVCPPGKLCALMADNDPYRGLDEDGLSNKRDFEEIVGAEVLFRHGKGHFNCARLDEEDTRLVEAFLGVVREAPRELQVLLPAAPTQAKAKKNSSGSAQQQRRRAHVSKPRRSKL